MARGDQIYVYRPLLEVEGLYEHHGIDCGDGTVIHYGKRGEATVTRASLAEFTWGKPVYRKQYPTCFIADTVVQRAESRLGEQKYNLLFNNCEHFATWCKTGIARSDQVSNFVPFVESIDPKALELPILDALRSSDRPDAPALLREALRDIKSVWDDLQPQYAAAGKELEEWDRVARHALGQGREDLARRAIARKLAVRKRAESLHDRLSDLASMTEALVRDGQELGLAIGDGTQL